jgi:signal peptidase I
VGKEARQFATFAPFVQLRNQHKPLKQIYLVLFVVFLVLGIGSLFLSRGNIVELSEFEVRGKSLSGLIEPGENVRVDFEYYESHEIERGDLVLFDYAGNENPLLKKVFGIPGDVIDFQREDGGITLLINSKPTVNSDGMAFSFSGLKQKLLEQYMLDYNNKIPEDAYLLLGNLSAGTVDSSQFGFVSKKGILGKIVQ